MTADDGHDRFDDDRTRLDEFAGEFLVACPRCAHRALVRDRGPAEPWARRVVLTCTACGHSAVLAPRAPGVEYTGPRSGYMPGVVGIGAAVDRWFHLPLWLQAPCCGETLWAYNAAHLDWLARYVGARLRERHQHPGLGWSNAGLASRLPQWMQRAGNRSAILDCIARIRAERLG